MSHSRIQKGVILTLSMLFLMAVAPAIMLSSDNMVELALAQVQIKHHLPLRRFLLEPCKVLFLQKE